MEDLTFGEQVKIILGRKGMTIKELAEIIEERTGKKMSRQNLTQRLGRDNFQEQDMRMIANILGCPFHLSILTKESPVSARGAVVPDRIDMATGETSVEMEAATQQEWKKVELKRQQKAAERKLAMTAEQQIQETEELLDEEDAEDIEEIEASIVSEDAEEVDMTIGELYEIHEELSELEESARDGESKEAIKEELEKPVEKKKREKFRTGAIFLRKKGNSVSEPKEASAKEESLEEEPAGGAYQTKGAGTQPVKTEPMKNEPIRVEPVPEPDDFEPVIKHDDAEEDLVKGDVNPYTGREFQTNSVRMHPSRIGYVQVYDRSTHKWTDMTEWAFLGYQERKKALLGKDYEPPIYLD